MQFKCRQCDHLHFDDSASFCPKECGGKYSQRAALIHWLVPTESDVAAFRAQVSSDDPDEAPVVSGMVLACKPGLSDPGLANRNVTTALYAVTCQECLEVAYPDAPAPGVHKSVYTESEAQAMQSVELPPDANDCGCS